MSAPAPALAPKTESKSIFKSKTFWFNLLAGIPTFAGVLPPEATPYIAPVVIGGNIILRAITDQPITVLPKGE